MNNEERIMMSLLSETNFANDFNNLLEYLCDYYNEFLKIHKNNNEIIEKEGCELLIFIISKGLINFYSSRIKSYLIDQSYDSDEEEKNNNKKEPV